MAVKNHNFRFNMEKDNEVRAWEILHSKEVGEDFRSQNEFVIAAINDYYDRYLDKKQDPYLESREKEEAFTQSIVKAVEQKVLDNLPGLAAMYMMQQQSLLSVMGIQGSGACAADAGSDADAADVYRNADVRAGGNTSTRIEAR